MKYETKLQIQAALAKRGWAHAAQVINEFVEALESTDEQKQLRADAETARSTCEWWEDCEMWESSCGVAYNFLSDGPAENEHEFCHKCGKRVAIDKARQQTIEGGNG